MRLLCFFCLKGLKQTSHQRQRQRRRHSSDQVTVAQVVGHSSDLRKSAVKFICYLGYA